MPFLHPMVFATGLGLVAAPIIIHLLNRRRFRLLDWAAMKFLLESVRRNRRRLRIEELILLALRCLAVLLLAMALARFTGCSAMGILPGGTESKTVVFLLDDSYSMGQRLGGGTLFAAAKTDLVAELGRLSQADQVAILLTSDNGSDEPFFKLTHRADTDLQSLSARLGGLTPSDRRARLDRSLSAAGRIFADDKSTTRRLCVYSDFRRVDLAASGAEADVIRKEFDDLRKLGVEVVTLDFGRKASGNLTVESLEMMDKFAVANVPVRLRLSVRNHGDTVAKDVEVALRAQVTTPDGLKETQIPVGVIATIDGQGVGRLELEFTCRDAGPALVTASLPADELAADNTAYLALDVREGVKVLAVDGRADVSDPAESESFFLVHALDPLRNGSYGAKVEVTTPDALNGERLADYDMVALLNVGELPVAMDANGSPAWPQLEALADYVRGGGGLAIFTGDRVNLAFYNGPLYADGAGLSPLRVGPPKGDAQKREKFFRLDPRTIAAEEVLSIFRQYLAAGMDPTQFVRFYVFTTTSPLPATGATADVKPPRVLARFADEDSSPAIVTRQFGNGVVLLFYTSASQIWNDWPADENGTYVAVLNDMLRYLARPQSRSLSARVDEPIVYELADRLRDAVAMLKTPRHPQEPAVTLVPAVKDEASPVEKVLRYDRAVHAGSYNLLLALPDGTSRQVLFARTVDPDEGDLSPGHEALIAAAFGSEDFRYLDRTGAQTAEAVKGSDSKEYWTWALAAVLGLLAIETFLGQRFGHYQR